MPFTPTPMTAQTATVATAVVTLLRRYFLARRAFVSLVLSAIMVSFFSGLLPCSGISAGVWCQYSILFPLCKGLSCIGCISHSLCPPQSSGRSPRRPAGGFCGLCPQRRLRRRGCAPHFRSPVLYPGQKSTCFITADALFLSIFRFLSIPPSACRSCLPQSFSRYPPASPAAAPSDRRKTLPYPTHRYGSAHTPPAPMSPAAIHCAE